MSESGFSFRIFRIAFKNFTIIGMGKCLNQDFQDFQDFQDCFEKISPSLVWENVKIRKENPENPTGKS